MGSNPQSDPRIFPEIPGFSRSLTHGLTHGVFYRPTLFACTEIPKKPEATGSAGRCDPGVGGSPTHTLSPAIISTVGIRCIKGGYPYGRGWLTILRERNFSSSSLAAFPVSLNFLQICWIVILWRCPPPFCGCDIIAFTGKFSHGFPSVALSTASSVGFLPLMGFH